MEKKAQLKAIQDARAELKLYWAQRGEIEEGLDASTSDAAAKLSSRSPIAYAALAHTGEVARQVGRLLNAKAPGDAVLLKNMQREATDAVLDAFEKLLK